MTHLYDIVDQHELDLALSEGLVSCRPHEGLEIYNYTPKATYTTGAWRIEAVRRCRGLIVEIETGFVRARPWSKFFHHDQPEAGILDLDAPVEVTDKIDGSLGIIYQRLDGHAAVATRGSMTSDQALHATSWLQSRDWCRDWSSWANIEEFTYLVEIIYPENRIVCDYGDRDELVLLGGVHIDSGQYFSPRDLAWPARYTRVFHYRTLRDALEAPPRAGAEGLCVLFTEQDRIVKIKQDDYVKLHKIVTGLSRKSVWSHILEHGLASLPELLAPLPDELHEWARDVFFEIHDKYHALESRVYDVFDDVLQSVGDPFTRKDFALEAVKHDDIKGLLFMRLDDKSVFEPIMRMIEPRAVEEDK